MTRGPATLVLALGLALALSSCGGSGNSDDLPQYVRDQLAVASDFGREIIADGTVTPAELERSVFSLLECLRERGYSHSEPQLQSGGVLPPRWDYVIEYPLDREEEHNADYHDCSGEYLEDATMVWTHQEAPTEAERQAAEQEVVACFLARTGWEFADFRALQAALASLPISDQAVFGNCFALIFQGRDNFGP